MGWHLWGASGERVAAALSSAVHLREWRNGRRASFRCWCPKGRGGSSPPSRTTQRAAAPINAEEYGETGVDLIDVNDVNDGVESRLEEPCSGIDVAAFRDVHIDDLAVLVDRPVHVPPHTSHPDVGFVDEPTITDTVPARPSRIDDQRGEALNPPINRHVINVDTTFRE